MSFSLTPSVSQNIDFNASIQPNVDAAHYSDATNEQIFEKLSLLASSSAKLDFVNEVGASKYNYAFELLKSPETQDRASKCFADVYDLLRQVQSQPGLDLDGRLDRRKWRAVYHAALALFYAMRDQEAITSFSKIEEEGLFRASVAQLADAEISDSDKISTEELTQIPSDVIAGVFYHKAEAYVRQKNYVLAWKYYRKLRKVHGNSTCNELRELGENRLLQTYRVAIGSGYVGQRALTPSDVIEISIEIRECLEAETIDNFGPNSITAVMPVYNADKRHLKQSIESVLSQTVLPSELIIVDDGSVDNSLSLLDELHFPFDLVIIKTGNGGQSQARNIGVTVARGTYIAFLDQDDVWYVNHLEELSKPFGQTKGLSWTYSNLDEIDLSGKMLNRGFLDVISPDRKFVSIVKLLEADMFVLPSASLISTAALRLVQGFDEELSGYEDDDLFIRLFRDSCHHHYVNEPLSQWRIHSGSCSYQEKMIISKRKFFQKLCSAFPDEPHMGRFWTRDVIAPRFFKDAVNRFRLATANGDKNGLHSAKLDMEDAFSRMSPSFRIKIWYALLRRPILYKITRSMFELVRKR